MKDETKGKHRMEAKELEWNEMTWNGMQWNWMNWLMVMKWKKTIIINEITWSSLILMTNYFYEEWKMTEWRLIRRNEQMIGMNGWIDYNDNRWLNESEWMNEMKKSLIESINRWMNEHRNLIKWSYMKWIEQWQCIK